MTISEYIQAKLQAFNIDGTIVADLTMAGVDPTADISTMETSTIGSLLISAVEECVASPRLKSISETGLSLTWDTGDIGKYYLYLCRKYGVTPNSDITELLGINTIIDISDLW